MPYRNQYLDRTVSLIARAAPVLSALPLLAACGDDLESRQSALEEPSPVAVDGSVGSEADEAARVRPSRPDASMPDPAEEGAGREDSEVIDATPESLIDSAEGFSTDPIDDTSGFDPSPGDPGGFAPEPSPPESFED